MKIFCSVDVCARLFSLQKHEGTKPKLQLWYNISQELLIPRQSKPYAIPAPFCSQKKLPTASHSEVMNRIFFNKKRTIFFLIFIQGRTFCHGTFEVFLLGGIQQQWNLGMNLYYPHLLVFYSNNLSSKCCLSILHIFNFFFHRNKIRDGINVVCFLKL